jgi:hypothetical protein
MLVAVEGVLIARTPHQLEPVVLVAALTAQQEVIHHPQQRQIPVAVEVEAATYLEERKAPEVLVDQV